MKIKFKYILFLLAFSVWACIVPKPSVKEPKCPEPTQDCYAKEWKGNRIDTSKTTAELQGWHYRIKKVDDINSENNEYQFYYLNDKTALLTKNNNDVQEINSARIIRSDRATIQDKISQLQSKHTGYISIIGDNIAYSYSYIPQELDIVKIDVDDSELVELSNAIGKSRLATGIINEYEIVNSKEIELPVFDVVNDWHSQPSYYKNKDIIFFASNLYSEFGETDIWLIYYHNGNWSEPINAGNINTNCDELTPFIPYAGNKIIYSSAGGESVGGYDLFEAEFTEEFIKAVENQNYSLLDKIEITEKGTNLKAPLNTEFDEISPYSPNDSDTLLYFSSNRVEFDDRDMDFDIYVKFKNYPDEYLASEFNDSISKELQESEYEPEPQPEAKEIIITDSVIVRGKVVDERNFPIEGATVTAKNLEKYNDETSTITLAKGDYELELEANREYQITAHKEELFYDTKRIITSKDTMQVDEMMIPKLIVLRINFPTDIYNNPYKYTLDSTGQVSDMTWEESLDLVARNIELSKGKITKLILSGHTDDIGTDEYNMQLSRLRVTFIIEELIKRGVAANLLEGIYYGERKPLEKKANESMDSYRKRLRRVMLEKVLEEDK